MLSTSANAGVQRPLMLYSGCAGNPDFLTSSHPVYFDQDPRHYLHWTNASAQPFGTRFLVVRPVGALFCDVYDLDVEKTLGTPFCLATKNSTGDAARLSASGSTTPTVGCSRSPRLRCRRSNRARRGPSKLGSAIPQAEARAST